MKTRFNSARETSPQGGTAIEGGSPRKIAKGDYIMVPANTPHQYTEVQGLIMMTLHMPVDAK